LRRPFAALFALSTPGLSPGGDGDGAGEKPLSLEGGRSSSLSGAGDDEGERLISSSTRLFPFPIKPCSGIPCSEIN
jgi:hypothetical protein